MRMTWFKKWLLRSCDGPNPYLDLPQPKVPAGTWRIRFWKPFEKGGIVPGQKVGIAMSPSNDDKVEVVVAPGWCRIGHATESISKGDAVDLEPSTGRIRKARIDNGTHKNSPIYVDECAAFTEEQWADYERHIRGECRCKTCGKCEDDCKCAK